MDNKDYKIKKDQIKRVISVKLGVAIASDEVMVQGKPIGYMERMAPIPEHPEFSGWTFASGEETQEYLDNPLNSGFYNLNTIANYDPAIIPHLDAAVGAIIDLSPDE